MSRNIRGKTADAGRCFNRSRPGRFIVKDRSCDAQPFIISDDATSLSIPAPGRVPQDMKDQQLLEDFKSSLSVIGFYSEDNDTEFHDDCSELKLVDRSKIPDMRSKTKLIDFKFNDQADLVESTEVYSRTSQKTFSNMLNWVHLHEGRVRDELRQDEDGESQDGKLGPDFLCPKSVLTSIFFIPYYFGSEVKFYASSVGGTVYLMKEISDQGVFEDIQMYSHKFEHYMYGKDLKERTFQNVDFRCMLKGMLGPYSLLYSASTDCADPEIYREDAKDLSAFYKLATGREIQENSMAHSFIRKALRIYLNCLMTTTPKAIVGFKKEPTFIHLLKLYEQEDLKKLILDSDCWFYDPIFAIIYATRILTYVKFRTEMEPGVVFSFTRKSKDPFIVSQKEEELGSILPKWFEERHQVQ